MWQKFSLSLFPYHSTISEFSINVCSRIDGNGLSGKIPEFIGNLINLDRLWVVWVSYLLSNSCPPLDIQDLVTPSAIITGYQGILEMFLFQGYTRNIDGKSHSFDNISIEEPDSIVRISKFRISNIDYSNCVEFFSSFCFLSLLCVQLV